jgi:hypothetical protein
MSVADQVAAVLS